MELGKFKIKQNEFKTAENAFMEEIKRNPNNHEANYYIGFCRKRLYRIDDAVEPLEKALSLNPSDHDYLYEIALTYRAVKKNVKAIETAKILQALDQTKISADEIQKLVDKVNSP